MSDATSATRPSYYRATVRGQAIDVIDIYHAFELNAMRGAVVKYVVRAGKKDPNTELEDLRKARECLDREIAYRERLDAADAATCRQSNGGNDE